MRLDDVQAAGGVDESFVCCMDEELMMKLRLRGPGYYLDQPGILFRVRPDQQSTVLLRERIAEKFEIIERCFATLPRDSTYSALYASARIFATQHAAGLCRRNGRAFSAWRWRMTCLYRVWRAQRKGLELTFL
jgi:hypothetical protein